MLHSFGGTILPADRQLGDASRLDAELVVDAVKIA
jgi:hypothetical protein